MKRLTFRVIVTSVYILPIFHLVRTSNSSVETTKEDNQTQVTLAEYEKYDTSLALNSSLTMMCSKNASIAKQFVWWFNDTIVATQRSTPASLGFYNLNVTNSNVSGLHRSVLFISSLQWNNTGLYRCSAGDSDVMQHYLTVEDPKLKIHCPNTDCYPGLEANVSQKYILRCYINQNPLYEPITWKINNSTTDTINDSLDNVMNVSYENLYLASTLMYTAKQGDTNITCSMGEYSTYIGVDVQEEKVLLLTVLVAGILVLNIILYTIMAISYYVWKKKGQTSQQESVSSYSNVPCENGRPEPSQAQPDNGGGPALTPVSEEWKRLCEQHQQLYGLKVLSCRSDDGVDVFSEAVFVDGDFKERFVVRSVSGKTTVENLEGFRKFQIRLTELPNHPNIVEVLGCYIIKLPYRICYEYFPNKTVRDYLYEDFQNLQNSKMHDMQAQKLFFIARGVANGMLYLKANKLDHVAVRVEKVLYFGATTCKLYDFSLRSHSEKKAKDLLKKSESLAWLGPDVLLRNEYNNRTDVWAYGVLIWELWSGGQTPYEKSPRLTMEMNMRNEKMLEQPANCPGVVYSLMLSCWKKKPSERRSYGDIVTELENLKSSPVDKNITEDYDEASIPGPSFYTALDESAYDHLSTL